MSQRPILIVTGLNQEARILAGPGLTVMASGGDGPALTRRLEKRGASDIAAVVSIGICGALAPGLRVGDVVIPAEIRFEAGTVRCAPAIRASWADSLAATSPHPTPLLGVDEPAMSSSAKADLHRETGAGAVDMESHRAAAFASRHALPFAALRIVSDASSDTLPPIAGRAMRPDGSVDILAVVAGLARDPRQLPPLIATGRNAAIAFRQLRRVHGLLGLRLGLNL